jgi:outer membrane protein assembly factor BamB
MWKKKLGSAALSQPSLMDRYIGYRGFRSYAFIGDAANNVFALDSDLARVEWTKKVPIQAGARSGVCPGGMTASVTQRAGAAFPTANAGRGGFGGRGGPAKSGVGAAGEGAITIPAANAAPAPGRGPAPPGFPGGRGRMPSYLTVVSSDGALHNMYISNGEEPNPPERFLPANANVSDLTQVDDVAYAVTSGNCGGVADGVWAYDQESKNVASWKGEAVGTAFGPDGTVYVTTVEGDLLALDAKTLAKKASYSAGQALSSAPVVMERGDKAFLAAAAKDGAIHVVDASSLAKVAISAPESGAGSALASWQDSAGARWILHANTAWKLTDAGLEKGWTAGGNASSSAAVVNGVVFLLDSGSGSHHAALRAFDGSSGKQFWSSGDTITASVAPGGGLAAGGSAVYLGTQDGTIWAFGFPIEH